MNSVDEVLILAFEEQLVDPRARRSPEVVAELLAEDFIAIESSGKMLDRASAIAAIVDAPDRAVTLSDFCVRDLSPGIVLATYRTGNLLRSSIWRRETPGDGGAQVLRIVFHQATPV